MNPENCLHGFRTPFLKKGNNWGYGLFLDENVIVGVRSTRARGLLLVGPAIAAIGGSISLAEESMSFGFSTFTQLFLQLVLPGIGLVLLAVVALKMPLIRGGMSEADAIRKADFVYRRVDISKIEIAKITMGLITRGQMNIRLSSGEDLSIKIFHKKVYEAIVQQMQAFHPESMVIR